MSIGITCGQCGKRFRVHNELEGFQVHCPECCGPVWVPDRRPTAVAVYRPRLFTAKVFFSALIAVAFTALLALGNYIVRENQKIADQKQQREEQIQKQQEKETEDRIERLDQMKRERDRRLNR